MLINLLLCAAAFAYIGECSEQNLVDHYVKIITELKAKAYTKPLPENADQHAPEAEERIDYGTFDHIIVGAGAAGSIIANRLSENSSRRVLVLEAGEYGTDLTDIPEIRTYLTDSNYNWGYLSVPQTTACLGYKDQRCILYRGKGIGGSTIINGLNYIRGNDRDYDNWYKQGNAGWSYKDVLPYFKKSENYLEGDPEYHGKGGYLNVETWKEINVQTQAFFDAHKLLGMKEVDFNGESQLGYGKPQFNIKNGKRQSTGNAFILPILSRPNLEVLTNSYVTKILIDKHKRASGVVFTRNGKYWEARSRSDIILSAGAFGSPHLLMLSGIGPRSHLENVGIPVVQDLPVGEHLFDHTGFYYLDFTTNYTETERPLDDLVQNYIAGGGPLANAFAMQGISFLQTNRSKNTDYPDVEIMIIPSINSNEFTAKFWNINDDVLNDVSKDNDPRRSFTIVGNIMHPKSEGFVRLNSSNPFDYPVINPMQLSDPDGVDIETMYEMLELVLEMINTEPFKRLDTKLKYAPLSACKDHEYKSRDYWYCFLRQLAVPFFHSTGTCKMGTHPSKGAVVNPELKVFGVDNLRVADASIMPSTVSGHTSAPTMMIGEKAADLIRGMITK
ncbi:glucose dehydrogenase [FAD, quinone]-like [Photinus pyralis]|uniref:glucose dehydrogenase [FAD, quinone]-like n=1 Tax=Photinus pyralis TaxID=7054 RepID=UPI0012673CC4|nr:glucose dehydrogenase [FAD, quinone]-like [Photinus pyralis]